MEKLPWQRPRRVRIALSATRCSAAPGCRHSRSPSAPENRVRVPCKSTVRLSRGSPPRWYSACWRPVAPSPRGTSGSPALGFRRRRTARSPSRRTASPRRLAGAGTAARLWNFIFPSFLRFFLDWHVAQRRRGRERKSRNKNLSFFVRGC